METRSVKIRSSIIGGGFPVAVQTMWKAPLTDDINNIILKIDNLEKLGCDIIRFSVPDMESADILGRISEKSIIPVVADIHFDYRLALKCIENGVDKIRINPGNIGTLWKVEEVVRAALDKNVPIRVGVNSGSLPKDLSNTDNLALAMVKASEREMGVFEKLSFKNVVFSLKSSDIKTTVEANNIFFSKYDYPLHLGVTEAGPMIPGIVKSTIAFTKLLENGIGDTIRVSLSDTPEAEVITAGEILKSLGIGKRGVSIISCPKCGRASFDTHSFIKEIEQILYSMDKDISVAVMGCIVNGPGEARHADLGITGSGDKVVIFKKGKIIHRLELRDAKKTFIEELAGF